MDEENIKKDALEIARLMRSYAEDCDSDFCSSCNFCFFCEDEYTPDKITPRTSRDFIGLRFSNRSKEAGCKDEIDKRFEP